MVNLDASCRALRPVAAACLLLASACAHLDPFGADLGRVEHKGKVVRAPYLTTLRHFDYLDGTADNRQTVDQKAMQVLFVWLPAAAGELGVRALSPAKAYASPRSEDGATPAYKAHKGDGNGFDVALAVERCADVVDPTDVEHPCSRWVTLGRNDPNAAMPASKVEGHQNGEVRLMSHPDDAALALVRGIYRIGIADRQTPGATGTYLVEVGVPSFAEGAVMAPSLTELAQAVRAHAKDTPLVPAIGPAHPSPAQPAPLSDALKPAAEATPAH